jgi:steroid 5-alpha reductase family enzyme
MNLMELTKKQTLVFFIMIYGFVIFIGILVMNYGYSIAMNVLIVALLADIIMTLIIFFFSIITKNASLYDPYWSVIPIFIVFYWMILYQSFTLPVIMMFIALLLWSARLTFNWWKNWHGFSSQDWRYDYLKQRAPRIYLITNLFGIHLFPTIIVFLQLINSHEIIEKSSSNNSINVLFIFGFAISIVSVIIQHFADKQMYEFRKGNQSKNSCIDNGLWKYSRHPNYLGELGLWLGVYIMYLSTVNRVNLNIVYPILMVGLFLFISIPMMEKKLMKRPDYKEYKNKVSMLLPYRKNSQ